RNFDVPIIGIVSGSACRQLVSIHFKGDEAHAVPRLCDFKTGGKTNSRFSHRRTATDQGKVALVNSARCAINVNKAPCEAGKPRAAFLSFSGGSECILRGVLNRKLRLPPRTAPNIG